MTVEAFQAHFVDDRESFSASSIAVEGFCVDLLSIQPDNHRPERTLLIISGDDPATLFGVLTQVGSLNLRLLSVELRPKS